MGLAVCAVTDDPKMVRTQFAPKRNGTKRLEAEGLLMGGSTWFTQKEVHHGVCPLITS